MLVIEINTYFQEPCRIGFQGLGFQILDFLENWGPSRMTGIRGSPLKDLKRGLGI